MADTVSQIEARVTGQMDAVKAKLDVVQMIKDNPWTALAVATGIGAAISATGSDGKAARAAVAGAQAAASKAKEAGAAAVEAARGAPAAAQGSAASAGRGLRDHLDELASSAVVGLVDRLRREDEPTNGGGSA
jgi:hydroxyethylthiazole kinase-like sugar kinase family protein